MSLFQVNLVDILNRNTVHTTAHQCRIQSLISSGNWANLGVFIRTGGRERMKSLPYRLETMRGSNITTTPLSVFVRISRPNPCRTRRIASGTEYPLNGFSYSSERAANTGSVGTEKGNLTTNSTKPSQAKTEPTQLITRQ